METAGPASYYIFLQQACPLAAGHKDLIVIQPLVPRQEWPLTRAKPDGRMKFSGSSAGGSTCNPSQRTLIIFGLQVGSQVC